MDIPEGSARDARETASDLLDCASEASAGEARGHADERAQVLALDLGLGRSRRDRRESREGNEAAGRTRDRQLRERREIRPASGKDADVVEPFAEPHGTGHRSGQRRLDFGVEALGGQAEAGQRVRAGRDRQIRPRDRDSVEDVFDAADPVEDLRRRLRLLLKHGLVLPVDPDVDRLGLAPGQIADRVLESLAEIGPQRRLRGRDSRPQVVDDLFHVAADVRGASGESRCRRCWAR